jgi:transposase
MTAVITLIVQGHPNSGIDDLMPWKFRPTDALADVA